MYTTLKHSVFLRQAIKAALGVLLVMIFVAPLSGLVSSVAAQAGPTQSGVPLNTASQMQGPTQSGATLDTTLQQNGGPATTIPTNASTPAAAPSTDTSVNNSDSGCSNSQTWSLCLSGLVYAFTVFPMSMFAYITSFVFDVGVQVTLNSITYSQDFVTVGWTAVRDLANMAFIFMLVYLAIIIVLEADTSNTMRMLASIIIVALLINFSFFISRIVIDGGNLLAVQFYNAINVQTLATTAQQTAPTIAASTANSALTATGLANTKDLTYNIMQLIGVQNLLGSGSFAANWQKDGASGVGAFFTNLGVFSFLSKSSSGL